jgi:imidazolonepropionase-like amidohydrolase
VQRLAKIQQEKLALIGAEQGERRKTTTEEAPVANGTNGRTNGNGYDVAVQNAATAGPKLASGMLVITNARIHPVTKPTIERGSLVIRDGLIEAVGANITTPVGAKVIDAAGGDVYPGWINARSTLGLADPGPRGFADADEMLEFNPQLRPPVAFHNDSDAIPITRANGVTTVAVTPAGGVLGGQVAVMNLDGWTWEESTVRPVAGIAFQFPMLSRARGEDEDSPSAGASRTYEELKRARDAKLDELRRLLEQARAYAKTGANRRTDWVLEALVPIVERRVPFITHADAEADIRDAVAFADRVGVKIVISGGAEAPLVASLMKEKNIPVIVGPVQALPRRDDVSHAAILQVAGQLVQAGVKIAFGTGDANNARLLPYHAAHAVAWGLSRDEAIKALTINGAEILGVGDRLGSIEPGKHANLLVAKGDPLEIRTEVTHVIIAGRNVDLDNKHHALYERYRARP